MSPPLNSHPPTGDFICDQCGEPGKKNSRQQKRHAGECLREYQRKLKKRPPALAAAGVRARQRRRNAA
jgi:hypothetical protein